VASIIDLPLADGVPADSLAVMVMVSPVTFFSISSIAIY